MKIMNLDVSRGSLYIDGSEIDLSSYEVFTKSSFFNSVDDITPAGKYRFFSKGVTWHNEPFVMEFNPTFFSLKPHVFLTSKTGVFYKNLFEWEKRANIEALKGEEKRMFAWMLERYPSNYKGELKDPPYGHV